MKSHNLDHNLVKNKKSGRYSIILDNDVISTWNKLYRMVIFKPLPDGKHTFCMERNQFYTEFEEAFDDDKAIELLKEYLKK